MKSNIKIGIVEDELLIAEKIKKLLTDIGYEVCEPVTNYTEALKMIADEKPDLLLLDILLAGEKDGIDIAHYLRKYDNIPFIFLTANSDISTIERAKEVHPPAYIVKPFTKEDLFTSIEIALSNHNSHSQQAETNDKKSTHQDSIFIKDGYAFLKIEKNEILYLKSDHVYVEVVTAKRLYTVRASLGEYLENFDAELMMRIHKSYAINLNHIDEVHTHKIILKGKEVPLGREYREALYKKLKLE